MKYRFLFLNTVFSSHCITQGVNNKYFNDNTIKTCSFTSLASHYHLNKFDGIFPINKHWLITRKVSIEMKKNINEKIMCGQLKVPLYISFTESSPKLYTITHYVEHYDLNIALLKVKEPILAEYIQLGKDIDLTDNNLWVIVSGKRFEPSTNENLMVMSKKDKKTFAAFSKITKRNSYKLTLRADHTDEFYEWAYCLLKAKQGSSVENDGFLTRINQEINTLFTLPYVFEGVPQSTDIGGIFLIDKENIKLDSKVFKPEKLTLIGLSTPSTKNELEDGIEGTAIDLTDEEVQEWVQETIFEHEVDNHDRDEYIHSYEPATIESDKSYESTATSGIVRCRGGFHRNI